MPNTPDIVVFPPVNAEKETKIRGLLRSIGEFMQADLEPQLQTIITVAIPKGRVDIYVVLNRIIQATKKENIITDNDSKKPHKESAK